MSKNCKITLSADVITTKQNLRKHSTGQLQFRTGKFVAVIFNFSNPFVSSKAESHGTSMAGLIASRPNNSLCSAGVAFDVNLGHIRLLSEKRQFSDEEESAALSFARQKIDIYVLGRASQFLDFFIFFRSENMSRQNCQV